MSIQPKTNIGIPEETRQVAKSAFPKGNVYVWIRDELGELYRDELFAELYPEVGQAADAVRARIDWKYALGMKLDDPGFDFSVLSEFRQRLAGSPEKQVLLDEFLKELLRLLESLSKKTMFGSLSKCVPLRRRATNLGIFAPYSLVIRTQRQNTSLRPRRLSLE